MEIEIIRIIAATTMLSIATFFDLYKREVHDYLWLVFGVFSVGVWMGDRDTKRG